MHAAMRVKRTLLGAGYYARRLRGMRFPGVAVLCYHGLRDDAWPADSMPFEELHVRASDFEQHCRVVREHCHPVTVEQVLAAHAEGAPLPDRPVLITFDDGYRSVYSLAGPVLARYELPAVVFVTTSLVAERRRSWFDAVASAHGEARVEAMKAWPHARWQAERSTVPDAVPDDHPCAAMTVDELRALATTPGLAVGAHTRVHPVLARAPREVQWAQIAGSRRDLEAWTGRPVTAFAYPNGRPGVDFTDETVALVREAGFQLAFSTRPAFARRADPALALPRFMVLAGQSDAELAHRMCYTWPR